MVIRNAFTIDLEEWFHGLTSTNPQVERWPTFESRVVAATERLLALLARHKVQATFFTLGHVADHHPALIEQIADAGHEIALHGYFHRFVHKLSPDDFAREIERTLEVLQPLVGTPPIGHRAPYFSIRSTMGWAFDILQRFGIRYDSSLFPMRALLYGDADAPRQPHRRPQGLWEYPPSILKMGRLTLPVGGGFYFRALPYSLLRRAYQRLAQQGQPIIFYLHPWELDTGQRYPHVTPRERLTHYHGRERLAAKLERLFADFTFGPLGTLHRAMAGVA
ncbi:MAG: DUF3473 domain-containing protein [Ardenticatenales bacterium]|nr:DUF3473 domain-containing protein [Ardenticatenales bacterium]